MLSTDFVDNEKIFQENKVILGILLMDQNSLAPETLFKRIDSIMIDFARFYC